MRFCKSTLATKLILLTLLLAGIAAIASLQPKISAYRRSCDELSQQIGRLEVENEAIRDDIRALGSDASVVKAARERLNFVFDDEVIYLNEDH